MQQKMQEVVNEVIFQNITTDQINTRSINDIGPLNIQYTDKYIVFDNDILGLGNYDQSSTIVYHTEYNFYDFINATNMFIAIFHNNIKLLMKNSFITVHSPTNVIIRIVDSSTDNTGYKIYRKKGNTGIVIYDNHTSINLSYNQTDIQNKIYFVDGSISYVQFTKSNGSAFATINGTGHVVEELTFKSIWFNDVMNTVMINGVPCLEFSTDTYISPSLIYYSNQTDAVKTFSNGGTYITHKHYQVPSNGLYYVVVLHNPDLSLPVDYPISKFESVFGSIDDFQSLIPSNFYSYSDNLPDPSTVNLSDINTNITTAFKCFPDLFKNMLENDASIDFTNITDLSMYPLVNSNSHIYPSGPNNQTFSANHYEFVSNKGGDMSVLFVDGSVAKPDYIFTKGSMIHTYYNQLLLQNAKNITAWRTGVSSGTIGSYSVTIPSNMIVALPPSYKFSKDYNDILVVDEDWTNNAYSIVSGWSSSVNSDDTMIISFGSNDIGKTYKIYNLNNGYQQYIQNSKIMAVELPWYLMYSQGSLFTFTSGLLNPNYTIMPTVLFKLITLVPMGLNYLSDVTNGEDIFVLSSPRYQLYEHHDTISTNSIITLSKKDFPFSKKYMMVFINGKFIHPDNIVEISAYSFALKNVTSTSNMCIYKLATYNNDLLNMSSLFSTVTNDWDTYVSTLSYINLKTLLNLSDLVNTDSTLFNITNQTQYLYEILYKFVLTETRFSIDEESFSDLLLHDFAPLVQNGRIVLNANRGTNPPRYVY